MINRVSELNGGHAVFLTCSPENSPALYRWETVLINDTATDPDDRPSFRVERWPCRFLICSPENSPAL
jgi:hypothetical protein